MKFLIINGEFIKDSLGNFITVSDNLPFNKLLLINNKLLKVGDKLVSTSKPTTGAKYGEAKYGEFLYTDPSES